MDNEYIGKSVAVFGAKLSRFEGVDIDIEVKAKVIYESDKDDIINQYIIFCKVFNEQTKQHGMTQKAVTEPILRANVFFNNSSSC